MSMQQRLSIVIPTFNRPSILPRAVASAVATCPADAEIIVVDDRSNTAKSALGSVFDDPRLRIVTNEGDKGAAGARNFGVSIARGGVILFLDDDDELIPGYPSRVLNAANQSDADFGFSAATLVDHHLKTENFSSVRTVDALHQGVLGADVPLQKKMPGLSFGVWIRKSTFQDVGRICAKQVVDEDGDLFCRLFGLGHRCWFEEAPGVRIHRAYATSIDIASQLTVSTDPTLEADCRHRTFRRNNHFFPARSADRWYLISRVLRFAARGNVDDVANRLLSDVSPIDWRVRGWVYWRLKKISALYRIKKS
jgi:glycosyltransferase involved in cell wall biosynthesis